RSLMSLTTSPSLTPVVVAPSVPQSMSMWRSFPPGSKVTRKQSPSPCRYIRTRTFGPAAVSFFFAFLFVAFLFAAFFAMAVPVVQRCFRREFLVAHDRDALKGVPYNQTP